MKKKPFVEIIDTVKEQAEYKKLCKGKSQKFTNYHDWEQYITSLLEKIEDPIIWKNFKHFRRNKERTTRGNAKLYCDLMGLFATLALVGVFSEAFPWGGLICIFTLSGIVIFKSNEYEKDNYFYRDILEIMKGLKENESG